MFQFRLFNQLSPFCILYFSNTLNQRVFSRFVHGTLLFFICISMWCTCVCVSMFSSVWAYMGVKTFPQIHVCTCMCNLKLMTETFLHDSPFYSVVEAESPSPTQSSWIWLFLLGHTFRGVPFSCLLRLASQVKPHPARICSGSRDPNVVLLLDRQSP